ncbi:hypothetical protein H5410_030728 [Solanum commersonii]|uniref:Uncharacterized protein n=1 Tax=Solanum commersonii TaxID=4109 RepID=A0A9J5YK77_SOLCO|nr:hypothetical protein H5410_030728 [Solanum commersonii]
MFLEWARNTSILVPTGRDLSHGFIIGLTLPLYLALEHLITVGSTFSRLLVMQELYREHALRLAKEPTLFQALRLNNFLLMEDYMSVTNWETLPEIVIGSRCSHLGVVLNLAEVEWLDFPFSTPIGVGSCLHLNNSLWANGISFQKFPWWKKLVELGSVSLSHQWTQMVLQRFIMAQDRWDVPRRCWAWSIRWIICLIGVECVKRMLMGTYLLTTHYDILEDLVTDAFEANEKENYVIVLSRDIEVVASASKDLSVNQKNN